MKTLKSKKPLSVCTFYNYHFIHSEDLENLRATLILKGELEGVKGLILLSQEGINATLVGSIKNLKRYLQIIRDYTQIPIQAQWQISNTWGFKKLRVKIKEEILKLEKSKPSPFSHDTHLTPERWQSQLKDKNTVVLDIRNNYEVNLGRFERALDLNLNQFKELSQSLRNNTSIPKDKNILIYCTGGIRCEKAINEMKKQGWNKVSQLKGGIINYLRHYPNSYFKGACFVFDHRVVLNQNLEPSNQYQLCPHCGQPGRQMIECRRCQIEATVCSICYNQYDYYKTCSKNCSYHYKNGHKLKSKKRISQTQ